MAFLSRNKRRERRRRRTRAKVRGISDRPRLSVYRSNKYIYAQIIDDDKSVTLAASSSEDVKGKDPMERAREAGREIARRAKEKKVKKVVFDRGGYIFTGGVKALAEGAREEGLEF